MASSFYFYSSDEVVTREVVPIGDEPSLSRTASFPFEGDLMGGVCCPPLTPLLQLFPPRWR